MTVSIDIGEMSGGAKALMDLEELLATRLLVQGNSGSGKSHLLRRLLEQSASWVQQAIIDPEGDFVSLAEKFGHVVVDAAGTERDLQMIAARVRAHRVSVVLNLESLDADRQMKAAATFLDGLFDADRDQWYPMLVVVDEAQLFAPAAAGEVSEEARRRSLTAMTNLMCRGRKRGLAGIIATQRLAKLAKNVAAEASNFLMGRTFLDIDMARAADLLGMERRQAEAFRNLDRGHFIALGPAMSRRPVPVRIGPVETSGRGGGPKLTPLPDKPAEDAKDLIFTPMPDEALRIRPRAPEPVSTAEILTQLSAAGRMESARNQPAPQPDEPPVDTAERDAAIDEIMTAILAEPEAAFQPVAALYQDFQVRCRIAKVPGGVPDLSVFREKLSVARAGVHSGEVDTNDWERAALIAAELPEDMRGVYLLLAKAALAKAPCPPNAEIAKAYGTRSPGRARWLLAHMEERGFLLCATDMRGNRIVTLTDLGWQTAPGDAEAAA
ncbi:ATP-binding protein [Pannonibacter indicus]|uniref:Archaeal DNA helicase HerA or a related bacterial ATPase, contains HAS-barrel and ATPase domains n=1 Tax=Pannonibacter indicus TaxID=466044 RepID=A0A0K6I445_9HYPH|nr:ATP-binding protein [Pannonibacter indicus]CUA97823.1 Archaeal DNA helicase HerA or a related bacterial ATPase, contains HAS-barrel and ATPase domains [Pannonibacter indicus]